MALLAGVKRPWDGDGGREPGVVLEDRHSLVVIEAKLNSGLAPNRLRGLGLCYHPVAQASSYDDSRATASWTRSTS
jgi:hypothetical protein